jgi:hypothetical protein
MGRLASRMALSILRGTALQPTEVHGELVIRESTAILRGARA